MRSDRDLLDSPREQLLPFEGSGFTTTWTLELPKMGNATALNRVTDVRLTFDLQASYDPQQTAPPAMPAPGSRSLFVSALAIDSKGLASTAQTGNPAEIQYDLHKLALPTGAKITNLAVIAAGVDGGSFDSKITIGSDAPTSFKLEDGLAMSNAGVLSDGDPTHVEALNAALGEAPDQKVSLTIKKGSEGARLARARDVLLWVEYEVPA
jgi:hypothetical protein